MRTTRLSLLAVALAVALPIASAQSITNFYAADAETGETLFDGEPLVEDQVINLRELGVEHVTVYATAADGVEGVRFKLNGVTTHYERESPYALFGKTSLTTFPNDLFLPPGRYFIRADGYADPYFRDRIDGVTLDIRVERGELECSFDVEVSSCDWQEVQAAVGRDGCNIGAIADEVELQCAQARARADAGTALAGDLIPEFDEQDLENYFNGGTYWNENTGTVAEEAPVIGEIYDNTAQSATIAYPNFLRTLDECEVGAVVCVWTRDRQAGDNNGNCRTPLDERCVDADPADNTDLCYADASRAPYAVHVAEGFGWYPGDTEGEIHAHGFAWTSKSTSHRFMGNLLFYISMYDHLNQRGYAENVPEAPMCGCLNRMPTISRADCTEVDVDETFRVAMDGTVDTLSAERTEVEIDFNACDGATANDLYSEIAQLHANDPDADGVLGTVREYLVGPEDNNEPSNCPTDDSARRRLARAASGEPSYLRA